MSGAWPWLAVAGIGALHGLNPATGWAFAVAAALRRDEGARRWHALLPIAAGHAASVALVAALAALGLFAQRGLVPWLAGGGAALAAAVHVCGHLPPRLQHAVGDAGLALWSLTMGSLHGTGMMLVPALIPLCLSASPARAITGSGSMALALAAVVVHLAAMLGATALTTGVASRLLSWRRRRVQGADAAPTWLHRKA